MTNSTTQSYVDTIYLSILTYKATAVSLAKEDQIDNTIDETSTPCNTLLSRSIDTGYKVRRMLTFKKDNAVAHGNNVSATEGLLDCDGMLLV